MNQLTSLVDPRVCGCTAHRHKPRFRGYRIFNAHFLKTPVPDVDDRLVRVGDPIKALDMDLWVLTHPDPRNTARIRALMAFLYDALSEEADLWGARRKATSATNFIPRKGWVQPATSKKA